MFYNSDLMKAYGNLVSRLLNPKFLTDAKKEEREFTEKDKEVLKEISQLRDAVVPHFDEYEFGKGMQPILEVLCKLNRMIFEEAFWTYLKTGNVKRLGTFNFVYLEAVRVISVLLYPVMPESCRKVILCLGGKFPISLEDAKINYDNVYDERLTKNWIEKGILFPPILCEEEKRFNKN
jgi:methionyl-tRNA synthetase